MHIGRTRSKRERKRERGGATRAKTKICIDEEIAEVARRRSQGVLWICVICIQWKRLRSNDIWSIFCFAHLPLFLFMYFYLIHNGTWVCAVNFYLLTNKQMVAVWFLFIKFLFCFGFLHFSKLFEQPCNLLLFRSIGIGIAVEQVLFVDRFSNWLPFDRTEPNRTAHQNKFIS